MTIGWRLLLASLFATTLPCAAQSVTLRFAYEDREIFPYMMGEGQAIPDKPGVTPEMVKRLQKKLPDLRIELQRMPWRRCLDNLLQGESDAIVASFNEDRMQHGVYPMKNGQPDTALRSGTSSYSLYKLKTSSLGWDGTRFTGLTGSIGAPMSWSIGDDLKKMGVTIDASPSTHRDFEKLLLNRVAGVAALTDFGDLMLEQPKYTDVIKVTPALASKNYYLLLSHQFVAKHPAMSGKIWRALAEIREHEGRSLMRKYLH